MDLTWMIKTAIVLILGFIVAVIGWVMVYFARACTRYKAKTLCSGLLVTGLERERLEAEELALFSFVSAQIDHFQRRVTASTCFGLIQAEAYCRPGFGCVLVSRGSAAVSPRSSHIVGSFPKQGLGKQVPWRLSPNAHHDSPTVNWNLLNQVVDQAFQEQDPRYPCRTRAVMVVKEGWVVAERYAEGITADHRLPGLSLAKSVTNAMVGILVGDGRLDVYAPLPVPEWKHPQDPRNRITLDHLLRMNSGLKFLEYYAPIPGADAIQMLFFEPDAAAFAAKKNLTGPPGQIWKYSSASTNIISRAIRSILGDETYWNFPYLRLFQPLGMESAVFETDPSGTFVGSSFMYATLQDWARFGLLYLQEGVWGSKRILPEGWIQYSTTPTPASEGKYGAHFWLRGQNRIPGIPGDEYCTSGFYGQWIMIIPSRQTVMVRLGHTPLRRGFDDRKFEVGILKAVSGS
ncbi:MAG: serine hydrolase [Synechococcaceae cyanobacterium SM2_3_1]|nr:serine hydrolase [Synechococcaceae cyanobacterium SM2_3_1]